MALRTPAAPADRPTRRSPGFVRHDFLLLAALLLMALVIAVPRLLRGEVRGALAGLLVLALVVLAGLALLLVAGWLSGAADRPAEGWSARAARAVGHLLRFALFGFIAALVAAALAANHGAGPRGQDGAALLAGVLGGLAGLGLHLRLGAARFWPAFRRFALALLGSFVLGVLALLGPAPWSVDAGVLLPLLAFLVLALRARARGAGDPSPGSLP